MPRPTPRVFVLAHLLAFAIASGHASREALAQPAPAVPDGPVRVRLQWTNADRDFEDTRLLRALAGDTLLLVPLHADDAGRVPFAALSRVDLGGGVHGNSRGFALALGVVGLGLGAALATSDLGSDTSNPAAPVLTVVGFGAGFALLGAGLGARVRTPRWHRASLADLQRALDGGGGSAPAGATPAGPR